MTKFDRRAALDQLSDALVDDAIDVFRRTKPKTTRPSMYKVLYLNDDYTTMEFVVESLKRYFHKSEQEAAIIMMDVHQRGVGCAGVFTFEIAETKAVEVMDAARKAQYPLMLVVEPEDADPDTGGEPE